jgi:CDP-diacylglycerol--glycerol-3-phosphate 3-phosphatidyltransferase
MAKILDSFKRGGRSAFEPLARALVRAGVSPNAVTIAGAAGVVLASIFLAARGYYIAGTIVITLACLLDVVDGAMARARGRTSRFGALLDSTLDRVADGALFGSVTYFLFHDGQSLLAVVCLFTLIGGQVVSYVRARAQSLGYTCDVGIAERLERLVLIGVGGLLTGFGVAWGLGAALWLLAVLTAITVLQRVVHVYRQAVATPELDRRPA